MQHLMEQAGGGLESDICKVVYIFQNTGDAAKNNIGCRGLISAAGQRMITPSRLDKYLCVR